MLLPVRIFWVLLVPVGPFWKLFGAFGTCWIVLAPVGIQLLTVYTLDILLHIVQSSQSLPLILMHFLIDFALPMSSVL